MKKFILVPMTVLALMACNRVALDPTDGQERKISFDAGGPAMEANISTKAAPSVNTATQVQSGGFAVNCVTVSSTNDVEVWSNAHFVYESTPAKYEADKWWPNSNPSYKFYAVFPHTYSMTFAVGGPTISVTDANSDGWADNDIICAFMGSPTYKTANTFNFEHIFARLCSVTVSAVSPYTISGVSIKITPKIGGTYNVKTGSGQTGDTGWSAPVSGSATEIANSTPGTKSNNIYLLPGTYEVTATWTATKGNYSQTFSNIKKNLTFVRGKQNNITVSFTGNGTEIQFGVSVADWGTNAVAAGTWPLTNS